LPGAHRELAFAIGAVEKAGAMAVAFLLAIWDRFHASDIERTAMRAARAPLPAGFFKPLAGGVFVVELGVCEIDVHGAKSIF
jgi:hypothetical protein